MYCYCFAYLEMGFFIINVLSSSAPILEHFFKSWVIRRLTLNPQTFTFCFSPFKACNWTKSHKVLYIDFEKKKNYQRKRYKIQQSNQSINIHDLPILLYLSLKLVCRKLDTNGVKGFNKMVSGITLHHLITLSTFLETPLLPVTNFGCLLVKWSIKP